MQYSMVPSETLFYLQSEHIPSKWENTRSNMQLLTELNKPTIICVSALLSDADVLSCFRLDLVFDAPAVVG